MIFFIGAGPGSPDLITVRGRDILALADLVIYAGSLVNPQLLCVCKPGCAIYNSAEMTLEQTHALLAEAEHAGHTAVRLHTGDPSLYGAIREQMDLCEQDGLPYAVIPGVSSFSAAAAALRLEYTMAERTQTLIISRLAGRTPVPEAEALEKLAAHHSSLVLFLSAAHLDRLTEALYAAGYAPESPVALVYKVSWPDEKTLRTSLARLATDAAQAGIDHTALVIVGPALEAATASSRLYSADFSTGPRAGEKEQKMAVIAFSERGMQLGEQLRRQFPATVSLERCPEKGLNSWTREHFSRNAAILFIASCGIAVRAIAPFVFRKDRDPAVLVMDESGQHVIPLLSGHLGGANALARQIAVALGAVPVLTTASDVSGAFAVDSWARAAGLAIENLDAARLIARRILQGQEVRLRSEIPTTGDLPFPLRLSSREAEVEVIWRRTTGQNAAGKGDPNDKSALPLRLIPRRLILGIGCCEGISAERIGRAVELALDEAQIDPRSLAAVHSIDIKAKEPGLLAFAAERGLPLRFFSAKELAALPGKFTASDFVRQTAGVDNVCERAAVACGATLLLRKRSFAGVTVALAIDRRPLSFADAGEKGEAWLH